MEANAFAGYPGRGLFVGRVDDGSSFILYYITGRSEASRARRAVMRQNGDICVEPDGDSTPDALRHYVAIASRPGLWLVGNGAHVAEIVGLAGSFESVFMELRHCTYEPDPPIFTPRIVGALEIDEQGTVGRIGVGAARLGPGTALEHVWLETPELPAGHALAIRTYQGRTRQPVTHADSAWVRTRSTIQATAADLWSRLHRELRVLVVVIAVTSVTALMFHRNQPDTPVLLTR